MYIYLYIFPYQAFQEQSLLKVCVWGGGKQCKPEHDWKFEFF
jgi:hypothetical protein